VWSEVCVCEGHKGPGGSWHQGQGLGSCGERREDGKCEDVCMGGGVGGEAVRKEGGAVRGVGVAGQTGMSHEGLDADCY
jgi:hypothetical protein